VPLSRAATSPYDRVVSDSEVTLIESWGGAAGHKPPCASHICGVGGPETSVRADHSSPPPPESRGGSCSVPADSRIASCVYDAASPHDMARSLLLVIGAAAADCGRLSAASAPTPNNDGLSSTASRAYCPEEIPSGRTADVDIGRLAGSKSKSSSVTLDLVGAMDLESASSCAYTCQYTQNTNAQDTTASREAKCANGRVRRQREGVCIYGLSSHVSHVYD